MASSVASPLERQFTTIAGVDSMTSRSGTGNTNVTLQFDLGRDIDSAAVDVQTAIAAVMPLLPPGMPSPPSFRKNNPADQPILTAQPDVEHAADVGARRLRGNDDRAAHLDGRTACRRCRCRARRSTRCACSSIPTSCTRSTSASTKSTRRCRTGTSTCRPASCSARTSTYNIKAAGQLMNADAFRPIVVDLPQRRAGPARAGGQRHRQRRERTQRLVVLHQAGRQAAAAARDHAAGDAPAGHQHHRGHRRGARAAAGVRGAAAAVGAHGHPRQDRSRTIREAFARHPGRRCSSRWSWSSA